MILPTTFWGANISDFTSWPIPFIVCYNDYNFHFFTLAITVKPEQIAEDMKRNGGFVPGIKPGAPLQEIH